MADTDVFYAYADREKRRQEEKLTLLRQSTQAFQSEYQNELQPLRKHSDKGMPKLKSDIYAKRATELIRIITGLHNTHRQSTGIHEQNKSEIRKQLELKFTMLSLK